MRETHLPDMFGVQIQSTFVKRGVELVEHTAAICPMCLHHVVNLRACASIVMVKHSGPAIAPSTSHTNMKVSSSVFVLKLHNTQLVRSTICREWKYHEPASVTICFDTAKFKPLPNLPLNLLPGVQASRPVLDIGGGVVLYMITP